MQFTSQQYAELFVGFFQELSEKAASYADDVEYAALFGSDCGCVVEAVKYALDTGTDPRVISLAGVLIFKALARSGLGRRALVCPERLIIAGLISANVVFEDDTIVFGAWQRATEFRWALDELKLMTMELFMILDFHMTVTQQEFSQFCSVLRTFTLGGDAQIGAETLIECMAAQTE